MRHVVDVADLKLGRIGDELVTFALGSCLGLAVYDPEARIGCLLHTMLPDSEVNPVKAEENPFMFIDTGVPEALRQFYCAGGQKERMVVKAVGCARAANMPAFNIGERNFSALNSLLRQIKVPLSGASVGGTWSRTVYFDMTTGKIVIKGHKTEEL